MQKRNEQALNVTNYPLLAHNKNYVVCMVGIYDDSDKTSIVKVESKVSKE